jgi:hypothetical protein
MKKNDRIRKVNIEKLSDEQFASMVKTVNEKVNKIADDAIAEMDSLLRRFGLKTRCTFDVVTEEVQDCHEGEN